MPANLKANEQLGSRIAAPIDINTRRKKAAGKPSTNARARTALDRTDVDAILGEPPAGISRAAKAEWYSVARRYPSIRAGSRVFMENYIRNWIDHERLSKAAEELSKDKEAVFSSYAERAYKRVGNLRTAMATALTSLASDLKKKH